jgi:hypothetical protein
VPRKTRDWFRAAEYVFDWPMVAAEWLGRGAIAAWDRFPRKVAIPIVVVLTAAALDLIVFYWRWLAHPAGGGSP